MGQTYITVHQRAPSIGEHKKKSARKNSMDETRI